MVLDLVGALLAPTRAVPLLVKNLCHCCAALEPDLGLHAAFAVVLVDTDLVARRQSRRRVVVDHWLLSTAFRSLARAVQLGLYHWFLLLSADVVFHQLACCGIIDRRRRLPVSVQLIQVLNLLGHQGRI